MDSNRFLLKVKGKDFILSFQGEGNAESAREALSNAFGGLPVSVISFGAVDREDMDGN